MKIFLGTLNSSDAPAIAKIYHCMNAVEYEKRMQEISVNFDMNTTGTCVAEVYDKAEEPLGSVQKALGMIMRYYPNGNISE